MYIARSKQFDKQYRKAASKVQKQFKERLKLFLEDDTHPLLHTHRLAGQFRGLKSFNVTADIRAVFELRDEDTLYLIALGSHNELYG